MNLAGNSGAGLRYFAWRGESGNVPVCPDAKTRTLGEGPERLLCLRGPDRVPKPLVSYLGKCLMSAPHTQQSDQGPNGYMMDIADPLVQKDIYCVYPRFTKAYGPSARPGSSNSL